MAPSLYALFALALALRLGTVALSRRHERRLRARGAVELGAETSLLLALLHALIYLACLLEGLARGAHPDATSYAGMTLYALSMLALAVVVRRLGPLWTVKLLVLPDHPVRRDWLFRFVRHPNYVLNLVPELIGLNLAFHAWTTLAVLGPLYLAVLIVRILQEERAHRTMAGASDQGAGGAT
ncbi:MAG TPA: isoprenylcysteine carboxylmethyltransferase family protein [Gammaproteobacteria bacterium]|nr:isoprenylcysteine carboxylmethyltransferase family protein [Gammaproteobacteria bacterium]